MPQFLCAAFETDTCFCMAPCLGNHVVAAHSLAKACLLLTNLFPSTHDATLAMGSLLADC